MVPYVCIFTGPMFAGKTSKLIENWNSTNIPKFAFKYANDKRYENTVADKIQCQNDNYRLIISHDNMTLPAIGISKCSEINKYINDSTNNKIEAVAIFIDEGQFFEDIKEWIINLRNTNISHVYISGLDYDIFGNKFNKEFVSLTEIADECHTITSLCYQCMQPAQFTQFIDNNSLDKLSGNMLIGGSEQYQPACKSHFKPIKSFNL
jgi:thymidine kinase